MKKDQITIIIAVCLAVVFLVSCFTCSLGDRGGDGKSSCKNCGRTPVYALGFCKSCYRSFMDFTYGEN